eukprot:Rhum_TRINITY_DN18599_c0_g1::Rhum_TRINITY_DN18599_c0_g1_i1::g.167758::m.167758/K10599/PRPF19, PRP19; pre-mRNA-processing factor 19
MLCALSGVVPEVPVVSVKTGLLFEKRLIETHLETSGRCPVTDQDLGKEDLVEVKHSDIARPRPVAAQSIPGLLQAQQTEWDAVMLENFQLKKQLDMARQELSHTLYRHDAACRVIARLMKERDEAVAALSSFDAHAAAHKEKKKAGPQSILPDDVVKRINEQAEILGSGRKKNRVISSTLASKDTVKAFSEQSSMAPHSSTSPGVLCVSHLNGLTLTGGVDGDAVLVNESSKAIVQKLQGHTKPVTQVLVSDRHLYTSSLDGTSRVWSKNADDAYKTVAEYKDHTKAVRGMALQPSGDFLFTCGLDSTWNLYDVRENTGRRIIGQSVSSVQNGFTTCAFHPDGTFVGLGTQAGGTASTMIFDIRDPSKNKQVFGAADDGVMNSLAFSENGYVFATGSDSGKVSIWDLRNLQVVKTLEFNDSNRNRPTPVNKVSFDQSGLYLAVCTDSVKIHHKEAHNDKDKAWGEVVVLHEHSAKVTDCFWGTDAASLITTSMDRQVKRFA